MKHAGINSSNASAMMEKYCETCAGDTQFSLYFTVYLTVSRKYITDLISSAVNGAANTLT